MKSLTWLIVLVLAIGFIGCSDDDDDDNNNPTGPTTTDHFEGIFNSDPGLADNITGDALYTDLTSDPTSWTVIDVRSAEHYNTLGHIPGAVNMTPADVIDNLAQIPADKPVAVVCYTGQNASHVSAALNMLGYDAWNVKFGMCGWTSDETVNLNKWSGLQDDPNSYPLETTANTLSGDYDYPTRELETDDTMEALEYYLDEYLASPKHISVSDVYTNLNDGDDMNDPVILNFWDEAMYNDGHLPGAIQAKPITMDLLAGIDSDKQVVVYCHTGQTSSKLTTWLNAMGYDAYSMLFGMNSIDQSFPGLVVYHAPGQDYPVEGGGN